MPGTSDRIEVHQVVDRYLEHGRIFVFGEGRRARYFIGSGDWMPRNFLSRVEVMAPIEDPDLRARLLEILTLGLADTAKGSLLRPDGRYERLLPRGEEPPLRSQEALERAARARGRAAPELRAVVPGPADRTG